MKYNFLFDKEDGESTFEDVEVTVTERTFAPPAKAIEVSDPVPASAALFLRLRAGWDEPTHASPVRQTLVCTRGAVRVTASDGSFRDIGVGDVWMMDDRNGKGHHTRVISEDDFECVIVQHP